MGAPGGVPLGPPFDIPNFSISGLLPPYLGATPTNGALMSPFQTTLVRIANKLCGSDERKAIFRGLLQYRQQLANIGFTDGFQWLSGSFLEDIETLETRPPNDVDLVTFCHRPAGATATLDWRDFNSSNSALLRSRLVKPVYKCDAYFVDLDSKPVANVVNQTRYWFGLFSHRRDKVWKGLLQVPLPVSSDDNDASLIVGP